MDGDPSRRTEGDHQDSPREAGSSVKLSSTRGPASTAGPRTALFHPERPRPAGEAKDGIPMSGVGKLDDQDYPAVTMGQAAELLGVQPAYLRSLDAAGVLKPQRSGGGHRRYSRRQLELAARMRALFDEGMDLGAATRIVGLQDELDTARARIDEHLRSIKGNRPPSPTSSPTSPAATARLTTRSGGGARAAGVHVQVVSARGSSVAGGWGGTTIVAVSENGAVQCSRGRAGRRAGGGRERRDRGVPRHGRPSPARGPRGAWPDPDPGGRADRHLEEHAVAAGERAAAPDLGAAPAPGGRLPGPDRRPGRSPAGR